jgi:hypothetical protein
MRVAIMAATILLMVVVLASGKEAGDESQLGKVIQELVTTMDKLTLSLGTIKDEPTAKSARPELRKIAAHWVEVRRQAEKMKPPSKDVRDKLEKEWKQKLRDSRSKLFREITRVKEVPGGNEAMKEISAVLDTKVRSSPPAK